MKEIVKIITVLTVACLLCAFFLALVQNLAEDKIELNAKGKIAKAISNLAPDYVSLEEIIVDQDIIYKLRDKQAKPIGYAFSAQGQGYQGKIKLLSVINLDLTQLSGIEIVESLEIPGLGAKIQEEPFKSQFHKLYLKGTIECVKAGSVDSPKVGATSQATKLSLASQIQAITGATVSSRAVVNILNQRIESLKQQIKKLNE